MILRKGDIVYYKHIPEFLSDIQHKILNTPYSHTSIIAGHTDTQRLLEFEADVKVRLHSYSHSIPYREVWEWIDVPEDVLSQVIEELIFEYEGKLYGFIQWPTIFIKRCFELLGFKNARSWKILWGWGVVCSELLYYFVEKVAKTMLARTLEVKWELLIDELHIYNKDTFTPVDLNVIQNQFKDIWRRKQ